MKTVVNFIIVFFIITNIQAQDIKQDIQEIRDQFKWVNQQKDFKTIVLENQEFTDDVPSEGCGLTAFYKNGKFYKIIQEDMVSNASYVTEYYLKNGKLIFVYKKENQYIMPDDEQGDIKTKVTYEERVYYKNEKIIRHLEKGKSVSNKKQNYQDLYKSYLPLLNTRLKYRDKYFLLQGMWVNDESKNDNFEITGLQAFVYGADDIPVIYRIYYDGRYLWLHNTEQGNTNDVKYEVLELSDNKMQVQDRLSGEVKFYDKIKD